MDKIFDAIGVFFGNFLYNLFSVIFPIIQGVQNLFFMFAGIQDGIQIDGVPITNTNLGNTEGTDSGIVYYLFQQSLVRNLLISIMVLAVFLMIVFTIMAFIKNAYVAKQKSWKEIIGKAIIGLANFVLLPACCLLGVWLGNILLQAVNGATSSAGVTRMDKKLFISCAYDANKYRTGEASGPELAKKAYTLINGTEEGFDEINIEEGKENEYYADIVDQIFQSDSVSVFGANDVHEYYNTWKVHFIILVVAGIFMLYVLGSLAFSMIRRMFILLMLYIISPALCAMYPLDDGAAVGNWKKEFVKQTISAYGAVAGLNIFFALIPVIDQIGQVGAGGFLDNVLQLFILVSGLFIVKEFISLISGYIGAEDSYAKGTGLLGSAGKKVAGAFGTVALGTTAVATRSIAASMSAKKGERGKALASSLWDSTKSGLSKVSDKVKTATGGSVDIGGTIKTVKDSSKAGKSFLAEKQTKKWEKAEGKRKSAYLGAGGEGTKAIEEARTFLQSGSTEIDDGKGGKKTINLKTKTGDYTKDAEKYFDNLMKNAEDNNVSADEMKKQIADNDPIVMRQLGKIEKSADERKAKLEHRQQVREDTRAQAKIQKKVGTAATGNAQAQNQQPNPVASPSPQPNAQQGTAGTMPINAGTVNINTPASQQSAQNNNFSGQNTNVQTEGANVQTEGDVEQTSGNAGVSEELINALDSQMKRLESAIQQSADSLNNNTVASYEMRSAVREVVDEIKKLVDGNKELARFTKNLSIAEDLTAAQLMKLIDEIKDSLK